MSITEYALRYANWIAMGCDEPSWANTALWYNGTRSGAKHLHSAKTWMKRESAEQQMELCNHPNVQEVYELGPVEVVEVRVSYEVINNE